MEDRGGSDLLAWNAPWIKSCPFLLQGAFNHIARVVETFKKFPIPAPLSLIASTALRNISFLYLYTSKGNWNKMAQKQLGFEIWDVLAKVINTAMMCLKSSSCACFQVMIVLAFMIGEIPVCQKNAKLKFVCYSYLFSVILIEGRRGDQRRRRRGWRGRRGWSLHHVWRLRSGTGFWDQQLQQTWDRPGERWL